MPHDGKAPWRPLPGRGTAQAAQPRQPPRKFGFTHLVEAIREYSGSARCANDLDREVVLERMRQLFDVEPEVLLRRGFDKAYRQVVEGV